MERTDGVETFVGIDAHSEQCSIKAISRQGQELRARDVPAKKAALTRALAGLPGPVWAMVESSYLAPRLVEMLSGAVDRLIVCETRENRWISHREDKGDQKDAAHTAATTALRGDNRFSRYYRQAVADGAEPLMAKRTVARKILATALVLLKTGAAYDDNAD